MSEPRNLRDLIGDDVEPDELERLQRVHALLEQAGPPPELPPSLARAAEPPSARVLPFPRRYRYTALAAAVIAAVALFGVGYLAAGGPDASPVETLAMRGTAARPQSWRCSRRTRRATGRWRSGCRVSRPARTSCG